MQAPIRFVGNVQSDEMLRAYWLAWRDTWQLRFRLLFFGLLALGAAFLAAAGAFAYRNDDIADAFRLWAWGALLAIWIPLSSMNLRRKVTRSLNSGLFSNEGEAIIDENGLLVTDGHANLQVPWDKFEGYRSNDEMVLYYVTYPSVFLTLLRRLCRPPDDWDRLLALTKERLGPR